MKITKTKFNKTTGDPKSITVKMSVKEAAVVGFIIGQLAPVDYADMETYGYGNEVWDSLWDFFCHHYDGGYRDVIPAVLKPDVDAALRLLRSMRDE